MEGRNGMGGFPRRGGLLQPLSAEQIEQIHTASLRLLEDTGLAVQDPEILGRQGQVARVGAP